MKQLIFKTNNDWTGLVTRLTMGIILFPHGAQKMLGAYGGYGFSGTMQYFTQSLHIPSILAFLVILIEFLGAICLIMGLATRLWSFAIIVLMLGIVFMAHADHGFFMNWFGNQQGEGYEYHLLFIGLALATLINGAGKYSLDERIGRQ